MKKVLHASVLCAFLFINGIIKAQEVRDIDSLKLIIKNPSFVCKKVCVSDTVVVNAYIKLSMVFEDSQPDSSIYFLKKGIQIATSALKKYSSGSVLYKRMDLKNAYALGLLGSYLFAIGNNDDALRFYKQSNEIGERYSFDTDKGIKWKAKKMLSGSMGAIAVLYTDQGDFNSALDYFFKSLKLAEEIEYKVYQATCLGNIGLVYSDLGNYPKALEYHFRAQKIDEGLNNKRGQSSNLGNIGVVYSAQGDHLKALDYFLKANKMDEELGDLEAQAANLGNIGNVYASQKNYSKALFYYFKAQEIDESIQNKRGAAQNLGLIGITYSELKEYDKAIQYLLKSLKINKELGNKFDEAINLENIGNLYLEQKKYKEAEKFINQSYDIALEIDALDRVKAAHQKFAALYESNGNLKKAFHHFRLYIQYRDSIFNEENTKASIQKEIQYSYDKKAAADSVKVTEEKKVFSLQLKQEKTQKVALYGGLALVCLFSIFMVNRFRVTNKQKKIIEIKEQETQKQNLIITEQKHLVEEKHKEITDSINYAERIQRSFLATKELLDENLKDYFVLFKPKDVVSGDFYWASILNNGNFALVTADSTGHGVPGAIMSLLNVTSLEKAIEAHFEPSDILNATRKTIIERLKKDGSEHGGKDGMDASLIAFDFKQKQLHIAAANNPVWIVRENNLIEVKPDKMPVGKHDKDSTPFNQQTINIQKGDVIYAITDGYPDQFGGEKGKKFMSKNLKELLQANAHLPMEEQKALLDTTFKNWVGYLEQVDDVTILGVRV
jgi:serine phosphatase RsbU (regulator of sigma subunit)/tetratricopeptide (TPR) repeat protein